MIADYFSGEVEGSHDGAYHARVIRAFEQVALLAGSDSVPLDDLLRLMGQRLCELLGVTRCSVYLRRSDGRFQGQVGYCVGRHIDAGVSKLVSGVDGFTAEILETGAPVVIDDATRDPRTIQRTMRRWGVQDMLGVPLVVDNEVIGIIYVDNQGKHRGYTPDDVKLAQAFAGLSALAVRQAWLYQQLGERVKLIDEQRRVLGGTTAVHSRVTRAVLDGASIDAILRLVVDLLGKPVVLYSPRLEVTAWAAPEGSDLTQSPGLGPAQLRLEWVRRTIASLHNGSSSATLRATPETRCRRLLVRMAVDRQSAGYLELCEIGQPFTAVDAKALEHASTAIALKLVTDQRNAQLHRQEREVFFEDVLSGRKDEAVLCARAAEFGIDPDQRHAVLFLQYADDQSASRDVGSQDRVIAAVGKLLGPDGRAVGCTRAPAADLILLEVPSTEMGASDGAMVTALRSGFERLVAEHGVRYVVVSDTSRSMLDLSAGAERVRDVAQLLRETSAGARLVLARDLDIIRLITHRDGLAGAVKFARDLLRPLLEHDEAHGGALMPTLETFAHCQGQIRRTSTVLGVHENTVRYRLNRIREISSIEPERLDSLLGVAMALQAQSLVVPEPHTGLTALLEATTRASNPSRCPRHSTAMTP